MALQTDDDGFYVAPDKYWIIRSPDDQGAIVAKMEGKNRIPDEIVEHSGFIIQSVSNRSALVDKTVDQSGLSDDEEELLSQVYPVR